MILAEFITQTLALLDDDTQQEFTSAHITAAIRTSLTRYSLVRPYVSASSFDGNATKRVTLTGLTCLGIQKVYHVQAVAANNIELDFYAYMRAGIWHIETKDYAVPTGTNNVLVVTTIEHTIDDLDAAAATTIPIPDQYMICIGAAAYACLSRGRQRVENNTLNQNETEKYIKLGSLLLQDFNNCLGPHQFGLKSAAWANSSDIDKAF